MSSPGEIRDSVHTVLRAALGQPPRDAELAMLERCPADAILDIARVHQILPALAPALENSQIANALGAGAVAILSEARANRCRNRQIVSQIGEIGRAFDKAGISRSVVLKGGAFLCEKDARASEWRFLTDIDLLVAAHDLASAVSAAKGLGYRADDPVYDPGTDPHYPALYRDAGEASVEIHTRLGPRSAENLLSTSALFDNAVALVPSGILAIPGDRDRFVHLIAHAQVYSHRFARRRFVLRDALDYARLADRPGLDIPEVSRIFAQAGYAAQLAGFVQMAHHVLRLGSRAGQPDEDGARWVVQTLRASADPAFRRRYVIRHWLTLAFSALMTPASWENAISTIANPARRRRRLATWGDRLRE